MNTHLQSNPQTQINSKQSSTVVGGWSVAVGRALDSLGYNGAELLHAAGVDISQKRNTDVRFSSDHTRALWALALTETGQENIGLQVARYVCPTTFHALGFSLWASNSLFDALRRMVRFEVLLNDGCHLSLDKIGEEDFDFIMTVRHSDSRPLVAPEGVDYFLGAVVKMFRDMSDDEFSPAAVSFTRQKPDNPGLWERYFNCPVSFGAPDNRLQLSADSLIKDLPTGNTLLAEQNDKLVEDYLHRLQMADLCGQVRSALIDLMPLGLTTLEAVASELKMAPRTLQYKLTQSGTTIQALRDQIREELARKYLQHSRQSITQIAYSLGFSDPAHLNRAFKRWSGETPTAFRARHL
ncbi:AraC family transcriptional regulator ligand-binding domain-containing protein [Amphritea atlantica]|uniref:AraC family transcriptional regulator ligand-binding domain-containing protein n=1 Tax=Amphritea atlantica TaxID=355243 RepID=A0ABY5GXL2_9GAMM|nr:AraC family transcriptional regulator ligand-binding domain-containing protein [Amphritea atlantica]